MPELAEIGGHVLCYAEFARLVAKNLISAESKRRTRLNTTLAGIISAIALSAGMGKGICNHFEIGAFVNANILAATTANLFIDHDRLLEHTRNPGLVASQDRSGTDLIILPEFLFTGGTFYRQHYSSYLPVPSNLDTS